MVSAIHSFFVKISPSLKLHAVSSLLSLANTKLLGIPKLIKGQVIKRL